jgi:hypothetical protein
MKHYYSKILILSLLAFCFKANAQCSSCTITISGTDVSNYIVNSGTTLCISPSGTATGLITVATGGILCNQGTINSTNLWVAGGTLNNYGTINTDKILTSGQGVFNNNGSVTMDSLLVTNIYSSLMNNGSISGLRLGNSDNSSIVNNGSITVDYMADSTASFTNNSSGSFIVNFDFANAYNSGFFNYGYYKVMRDFYNSTGSTFEISCMGIVGRDWYNTALISGPSSSCGGFNIAGASYNTGTVGSASTHVDLCDAGHPAWGIDGPSGTIASTTTYCTCTNICVAATGIEEAQKPLSATISSLYPNPAVGSLSVIINTDRAETLTAEVIDMTGRKQSLKIIKAEIGENKAIVDVSTLAQGTYIMKITDERQSQSVKLFNVSR